MVINSSLGARIDAFEARIENRLQELFNEFKRCLLKNLNKSQHDESSSLKGNKYEKYNQRQDTGYPHMKFFRWEDEDPIGWISRAKIFSHFHETPEESKVKIAST
ncbi:hypothetical protein B296_00049015 [Ensete ventricosum]|uniref:Uncharacterized protein n=1 Tax=Ensete ventricosum TaxID=4639 RepID=A0A426YQ82_ENSVE|nr:hypothetical protein B296_00049015 [Ensete ventricosum]